jgi:hypothetical protein
VEVALLASNGRTPPRGRPGEGGDDCDNDNHHNKKGAAIARGAIILNPTDQNFTVTPV